MRFWFRWFIFALATLAGISASGQTVECSASRINESVAAQYPPLARAMHLSGTVSVMVRFTQSGDVETTQVQSGPEGLREATLEFVKGWHSDISKGGQSCIVSVEYRYDETPSNHPCSDVLGFVVARRWIYSRRYSVIGRTVSLCDRPSK